MKLNLNDILGQPGGFKPFEFSLDLQGISFYEVSEMRLPFPVTGEVVNVAGALELKGSIEVDMTRLCDRCTTPVEVKYTLPVTAHLADTLEDEENPDIFLLEDGAANLDNIFTTFFVLSMESKFVCQEECKGLCVTCGANLNDGPCDCVKEIDPRLAALQQLLDGDES